MDPNNENENSEIVFELADEETIDESASVDDFIRELEAKEKDLHITAETTFIELAADFDEGGVPDSMLQNLTEEGTKTVKPAVSEPASQADGPSALRKLEGEVASLKNKIAGLEEERTELYKNSQRRLKDFEAFKARTERERKESYQRQLSNLATQMLPALDNLDRALLCASDLSAEKHGAFAQFFDGIVLVNQQVNEVLVGMGIEPIATVGGPFDPNLHEAVAVDEESQLPPNTVTAELLRGFRIGESVIRHSTVKVSKAELKEDSISLEPATSDEAPRDTDETAGAETEIGVPRGDETAAESPSDERVDVHGDDIATDIDDDDVTGFSIERNGEIS
jgi:molecular chaperone GrpE